MEFNIPLNTRGHKTKIVEKKDTAAAHGSGLAEVFATPALIALLENTAYTSIQQFLSNELSSVGISINVQHLKASLPGAIIISESEVIKVDGKKVFFTLTASDENGIICSGEHTRYIINSEEFMRRAMSPPNSKA